MYDKQSAYFTVKNLMMGLIGMTHVQKHQEKEKLMLDVFKDPFVLEHVSMLNDLFGMKVIHAHAMFVLFNQFIPAL